MRYQLEPRGFISYPAYIDQVSIYLGKFRDLVNSDMNEESSRFKRGDRSEQVNILGIRGELIFQHHLFTLKIPYRSGVLLTDRPVAAPDVIIGDWRVDVKTLRSDAPDLLVNAEAHRKAKGIDMYVFVQVVSSGIARYWAYRYDRVSNWEVKNCHYSDAYFLPVAKAGVIEGETDEQTA